MYGVPSKKKQDYLFVKRNSPAFWTKTNYLNWLNISFTASL